MNTESMVFSKIVDAGKKKYYVEVKTAKNNSRYLSIAEVSEGDTPEKRESRRILVFNNAIAEFSKTFREAELKLQ